MDGRIICLMLICHFAGDYYMQTGNIAKYKTTSFYYTGLHSLLYAVPFALAWGLCRFRAGAGISILIMAASHGMIDMGKCCIVKKYAAAKKRYNEKAVYVIDQLLHFAVIYGCARYIPQGITGAELLILGGMELWGAALILYLLFLYQPFHISYEILRKKTPKIYDTFDPAGIPVKMKNIAGGIAVLLLVMGVRIL